LGQYSRAARIGRPAYYARTAQQDRSAQQIAACNHLPAQPNTHYSSTILEGAILDLRYKSHIRYRMLARKIFP
jgi:hypothetical protein